nr:RNA-directed DNA polymerase, eukaryota, reverse transcriptase zinc-binding domain protein [Tanacetum cinerariifolium]
MSYLGPLGTMKAFPMLLLSTSGCLKGLCATAQRLSQLAFMIMSKGHTALVLPKQYSWIPDAVQVVIIPKNPRSLRGASREEGVPCSRLKVKELMDSKIYNDEPKFPPGFTLDNNDQEKNVEENIKDTTERVQSLSNKLNDRCSNRGFSSQRSMNSHSQKSKVGGSILDLMDQLVTVVQTMGYNMAGLGNKAKRRWIKELCQKHRINFASIQETKAESISLHTIGFMGNQMFDHVVGSSVSCSGGIVMSSASSAVTYTSVYIDSEPWRVFWGADEELSDGGSARVIVYGYDRLPMQPLATLSPDYIPSPEEPQTPPPIYREYIPLEDKHVLPVEEQPLPPIDIPTAESQGYVAESNPKEDPEEYEDDETEDVRLTIPWMGEMMEIVTPEKFSNFNY